MTSNQHAKFTPTRPIHLSAKGIWEFTPEALKEADPKPAFYLHIPTYAQRDTIAQLLFQNGCRPVTVEHSRSVLLSELYEVFDTNPGEAAPRRIEVEEEDPENPGETRTVVREVPKLLGDPDEMAAFLEGYYQRADVYERIILDWGMQEKERLLDEIHSGQKTVEGVPLPPAPFTPRETSRATRMSMDMLDESPAYRRLQSQYADYEAREDLMMFRLFCAGWDGLETPVTHLRTGLLAEGCAERLREELAKLSPDNPNQFFHEVVSEIRQLMVIDKELEKNSGSPLGNDSSPDGSTARSDESDTGDGSWTASNTAPAPASESTPTSATLSKSPSRPGGRKPRRGRTAAQ